MFGDKRAGEHDTHENGTGNGSGTGANNQTRTHARQPLSMRDDAVLRAMLSYAYLTAEQVCRLYYSPGSLAYVRRLLMRLTRDGYLQRLRLPAIGVGNQPFVYRLARLGLSYLAAAGLSIPHRFRPAEHLIHSAFFLTHTLAVNDFLIAGACLEETVPGVRLLEMRHEQALKRHPMTVTLADDKRMATTSTTSTTATSTRVTGSTTLAPDGWLDYALPSGRMSVLLELDRGTEGRAAIERKLHALIACTRGPYEQYFGSNSLNVAFATTSGGRRADVLLDWCEQALRVSGSLDLAPVFLVTAIPPGPLDAHQTFLAPFWQQPGTRQAVSLLRLEK